MSDERTTAAIQRYLDALQGDTSAEPLIRDLLDRAAQRLRQLSASLLHRSYPRLAHPPLYLEADELLDGVVAGLLKTLQKVRPQTVRQFFALANQHMRWQLNDLARLLDKQPRATPLADSGVEAPPGSSDSCISPDVRRMLEAIEGLPESELEVFDLVRIQGLTHAEAARVIGVSPKTVQRCLNRARLLLATQLADLYPAARESTAELSCDTPKP